MCKNVLKDIFDLPLRKNVCDLARKKERKIIMPTIVATQFCLPHSCQKMGGNMYTHVYTHHIKIVRC